MLRHRSARMHARVLPFALLIALSILAIASGSSTPASASDSSVRLLVKFKAGSDAGHRASALSSVDATALGDVPDLGVKVISVPAVAADAVLQHLRGDDDVAYAEPDVVLEPQDNLPNDPSFPQQS